MNFYRKVMAAKEADHNISHNNIMNQRLHLISSSMYMFCYFYIWVDFYTTVYISLVAFVVRQAGHYFFEPPNDEKKLLGFTTESKCTIVSSYVVGAFCCYVIDENYAKMIFMITAYFVFDHITKIIDIHGVESAVLWFVKLITDPITDVITYRNSFIKTKQE